MVTPPVAPLVSVVVPVRNRPRVLQRAVETALEQSFQDLEVVVVDDASTDATLEVAQGFTDERVRVVALPERGGAAAARNRGIDEARGELVAFLDSDDTWHPTKLQRQVDHYRGLGASFGVVYTGYWEVEDGDARLGQVPRARGDLSRALLHHDHLSPTSTVMVETEALRAVGGFDEDLPARQDYDLWLRLSEHVLFDHVQDPLVTLHIRGDSITSDVEARVRGHERVLEKVEHRIRELAPRERDQVRANHAFTMGLHLHEHGERERARERLREALRLNPRHGKAWVVLAAATLGVPTDHPWMWRLRDGWKRVSTGVEASPPPQMP